MDFELSETQRELARALEEFARGELAPLARGLDEREEFLPREVWLRMGELGYLGLPLPEEYGGAGLSPLDTLICMEAVARGGTDGGTMLSWGAHMILASVPIHAFGTAAQRRRFLPRLARGEWIGALALTEPNAGSDAGGIATRAERRGDSYVLNGSKTFITNGPICDVAVVFAVTDPDRGPAGISAFLVERGFPGFSAGPPLQKMGVRASPTGELFFDACPVPVENRLGAEGEGFRRVARSVLEWERIVFGYFVGVMEENLRLCLTHARNRVQFGRPIAEYQGVSHKLAEMRADIDAARLLTYRAAWMLGRGLPCGTEASVAKLFLGAYLARNVADAVQIFGGYGLMRDNPVERAYRDAKIAQIGGGTTEIQKHIIARALLK